MKNNMMANVCAIDASCLTFQYAIVFSQFADGISAGWLQHERNAKV